jgi:hypothetical protein
MKKPGLPGFFVSEVWAIVLRHEPELLALH